MFAIAPQWKRYMILKISVLQQSYTTMELLQRTGHHIKKMAPINSYPNCSVVHEAIQSLPCFAGLPQASVFPAKLVQSICWLADCLLANLIMRLL